MNEDNSPQTIQMPVPEESQPTGPKTPNPEEWSKAIELLKKLLNKNEGSVSTRQMKEELNALNLTEVELILSQMKYSKTSHGENDNKFCWYYRGRSFLSEKAFAALVAEEEAVELETQIPQADDDSIEEVRDRKRSNEEHRLGNYVVTALEELYDSDYSPESYVFDVHNERPSGNYRNVDLVAVDWRTASHYELISVEVKLGFTAQLIQQAASYLRFSHRVWVAVPVPSNADPAWASSMIRDEDPLLYDHAIDLGIGILACRKAKGRSYEVFPIQWPKLNKPNQLEIHHFTESYRRHFEEALVLDPINPRRKARSIA